MCPPIGGHLLRHGNSFDLSLAGDQQSDQCGGRENHDECAVATRRIHQPHLADQVAGQQCRKLLARYAMT